MWDYIKLIIVRIWNHLLDFWIVWFLLVLLLVLSYVCHCPKWCYYAIEGIFVFYLLGRPISMVYGLVGGSASIKTFLINFILITLLFSFIYYGLFFRNAGVCYDGDNPQLEYAVFENQTGDIYNAVRIDTTKTILYEERITDSMTIGEQVIQTRVDTLAQTYHRVTLGMVIENSLMTSLTQSPSDFFFIISDFGESMNTTSADIATTRLFSITLLIHVLISWIFLGVFISLLYSKFRYEA